MKFKNILLIGMPGCGKSTIGKLLAEKLLLPFYDVDAYIEEKEKKSIKKLFVAGEESFRKIESKCFEEILAIEGLKVIATGGGIVKIPENMEKLNQHTVTFFLNRPVEQIVADIDISTRPLLSEGAAKVYALYKERYPLYKKYCHYEIHSQQSITEILEEIIYILR